MIPRRLDGLKPLIMLLIMQDNIITTTEYTRRKTWSNSYRCSVSSALQRRSFRHKIHHTLFLFPMNDIMKPFLLLYLVLPLCNAFTSVNNPHAYSFRLYLDGIDGDDGREDQPRGGGRGEGSINGRKRMKRRVDYPSFAYNAQNQYEVMRRTSITESPNDDDVIATYKQPCGDPRTVSIPEKTPTNDNTTRLVDKFINAITSPSFGFIPFEVIQVTNAARSTRLLSNRCYARKDPFETENIAIPPSLADLSPPPAKPLDRIWISSTFRIGCFALAYFSLPLITELLNRFVTMAPAELDDITGRFTPGISILYGTFVSLTLSILYNRQQAIQSNVSQESSLLTMLIRNLLTLFRNDQELAVRAGQCAADQIRTLVRTSRGGELLQVMYSDPYDKMMELIDLREDDLIAKGQTDLGGKGGLIAYCRDILKELNKVRATRLSDEALALPPTHFVILNALTTLILLGYVVSILPTVDKATGAPSTESCFLFGFLCTVYILFYNFISDLNNPFQGVYQVRRSSTASHLLEAKWLIANHPLLRGQVDFEQVQEEPTGNVLIRSPGLGDLKFEKDDIFPDSSIESENDDDDDDSDNEDTNGETPESKEVD